MTLEHCSSPARLANVPGIRQATAQTHFVPCVVHDVVEHAFHAFGFIAVQDEARGKGPLAVAGLVAHVILFANQPNVNSSLGGRTFVMSRKYAP